MTQLSELRHVGLVYNGRVAVAEQMGCEIATWLDARGVTVWMCELAAIPQCAESCDLVIVLGGDGSILRATRHTATTGTPLLGVNLGRVGFLTEAPPDAWREVLQRAVDGAGWIETRAMLRVSLLRAGDVIAVDDALNDAVVSRGALARTVHLQISVDDAPLTRYVADGLILATATGSTAYAYAAGGPILPPWLDNIVVIPIAPHLSLDRPLVLDARATVTVEVLTEKPGMLTVDGRMEGELHSGDIVRAELSPLHARFLRLRQRGDFYRTLVPRLSPRNHF